MKYVCSIFFLFLISCTESKNENLFPQYAAFIDQNISKTLPTKADHINYLETLFEFDQSLRDPEVKIELLKKHNFDTKSVEYQQYLNKMNQGDSITFFIAKKYLDLFGYPTFDLENYKAQSAVIAVALHQDYKKQRILFPFIYEAYKSGNIEEKRFSFLLNRMYDFKFGKRFVSNYTHTEQEKISQLIEELEIEN